MKLGTWWNSLYKRVDDAAFGWRKSSAPAQKGRQKTLLQSWQEAFGRKSMPETYYIESNGYHNYSKQPGFTIIDPAKFSSLFYGGHAAHNFIELFHCIPEIFSPIHAIASRVANADWQFRDFKTDEVIYDDRTWNRLYETPNPLQHFRELIYEAVVYELVTGNEFMYFNTPSTLAKSYTNVSAIWNLPADQVEIVPKTPIKLFTATSIEDIVKEYRVDTNNAFEPKNVLHLRATNIKWEDGKLNGKSPLLSADKAIANLIAVYEARNVIYTKRGALGAIVNRKVDASGSVALTKGEKRDLREEANATYGVTGGRDLYAITDVPIDFIRFGMSIQELQPFEESIADAAAIYGVLGVPFELAPKAKGETFSNQLTAERSFYQNVIIPKALNIAQSITNKLGLTMANRYVFPSFANVEVLQENLKEKSEIIRNNTESYLKQYQENLITKNQLLVGLGHEQVDGGDVYNSDQKNNTPLAVRLGIGGTQALQSVIADPNLSEESKKNIIVILFGIPEADAARMVVGNNQNNSNGNSDNSEGTGI